VHGAAHWRARTGGDQPAPNQRSQQRKAGANCAEMANESWSVPNCLPRQPFRPAELYGVPPNPGEQSKHAEGDHGEPVECIRRAAS
jgi:hypothetical protein